jgi:hypothetical protein
LVSLADAVLDRGAVDFRLCVSRRQSGAKLMESKYIADPDKLGCDPLLAQIDWELLLEASRECVRAWNESCRLPVEPPPDFVDVARLYVRLRRERFERIVKEAEERARGGEPT